MEQESVKKSNVLILYDKGWTELGQDRVNNIKRYCWYDVIEGDRDQCFREGPWCGDVEVSVCSNP